MSKPVVAIYSRVFLTISMTFVYRQLIGVSDWFEPLVLTSKRDNGDEFPFSQIYEKVESSELVFRVFRKLLRLLTQKYTSVTRAQRVYWCHACRMHDARLIHSHFGPGGLQMLPLAQSLGIPLLVTFHGNDASALLANSLYVANLRRLFDYAYLICVSKSMRERLIQYGANPDRTLVHYIGVPLSDFKMRPRKSIRLKCENGEIVSFLQVSNFVEKKGHAFTVEAFQRLLGFYPECHMVFAGDGPLRGQIEQKCRDLGISNRVTFVGKVVREQVIELMYQADIFVHHSITADNGDQEGIPTVLMEAMATGLPVLSTYHSGIPELIQDGVNGLLVPERHVEQYVRKMIEMLRYSDEYGVNAFKTIHREFNMDVQNEKLREIYKGIISAYSI